MKSASKILASTVLAVGFAAPAVACEFHGAGFAGFYGGGWKPYAPHASIVDPAANQGFDVTGFESDENLFGDPSKRSFAPQVATPPKPQFSSFAVRASQRALANRAAMRNAKEDDDAPVEIKSDEKTAEFTPTASYSDRETIRN